MFVGAVHAAVMPRRQDRQIAVGIGDPQPRGELLDEGDAGLLVTVMTRPALARGRPRQRG